jgi:hypothetical protein
MAALAQSPQPVLVGFTDLTPGKLLVDGNSPVRAGVSVVEQPLLVEGADSMLAQWARVRLAGVSGSAKDGGFLDAYDIVLPNGAPTFNLAYNPRTYESFEVWDWAAAAWKSVPGQPPASGITNGRVSVPIAGSLIGDGLVRVRVKELTVSWGADLFLPS